MALSAHASLVSIRRSFFGIGPVSVNRSLAGMGFVSPARIFSLELRVFTGSWSVVVSSGCLGGYGSIVECLLWLPDVDMGSSGDRWRFGLDVGIGSMDAAGCIMVTRLARQPDGSGVILFYR